MSALLQWEQKGPYRPMTSDGTRPAGDCVELPEPHAILMGSGITDHSGRWRLDVRPATCIKLAIIDWVSMVATPSYRHDGDDEPQMRPYYVTTAWAASGGMLILHVQSWRSNGEPAPEVPFSWHAAVVQHLE